MREMKDNRRKMYLSMQHILLKTMLLIGGKGRVVTGDLLCALIAIVSGKGEDEMQSMRMDLRDKFTGFLFLR